MFICEKCKGVSESGEKMNRVTIKIRKVRYQNGSTGVEIVKEIGVCLKCKGGYGTKD